MSRVNSFKDLAITSALRNDIATKISTSEKGQANGVCPLNSSGLIDVTYFDPSVLTFMGSWNASTNTPTLANGTGGLGDIYMVSVGGTRFGQTFIASDFVIYDGSNWKKIEGQGFTGVASVSTNNTYLVNVDNTNPVAPVIQPQIGAFSPFEYTISTTDGAGNLAFDNIANFASATFCRIGNLPRNRGNDNQYVIRFIQNIHNRGLPARLVVCVDGSTTDYAVFRLSSDGSSGSFSLSYRLVATFDAVNSSVTSIASGTLVRAFLWSSSRNYTAGTGITIDSTNPEAPIIATTAEANTGANVGTGTGTIFRDKTGTILNLKSLATGSTRLAITNNANDVTMDVAEANLVLNNIGGTLGATKGGSGQTVYAVGDVLQANTTTSLARLAGVATGNALISGGVGVVSSWGKVGLTTHVSGTLPIANGGTNLTTYAIGDLIQASATTTLARLASVATGNALISGGVGVVSSWGKVGLTTHVSGTLPVANGGTNLTTYTAGDLIQASATNTLSALPAVATGNVLLSGGVGVASSWGKVVLGTHTTGAYLSSSGLVLTGAVAITTTPTITLNAGNITTGTDGAITTSGSVLVINTNLIVTGSLTINSSAQLRVNGNIFLYGSLSMSSGSVLTAHNLLCRPNLSTDTWNVNASAGVATMNLTGHLLIESYTQTVALTQTTGSCVLNIMGDCVIRNNSNATTNCIFFQNSSSGSSTINCKDLVISGNVCSSGVANNNYCVLFDKVNVNAYAVRVSNNSNNAVSGGGICVQLGSASSGSIGGFICNTIECTLNGTTTYHGVAIYQTMRADQIVFESNFGGTGFNGVQIDSGATLTCDVLKVRANGTTQNASNGGTISGYTGGTVPHIVFYQMLGGSSTIGMPSAGFT